MCSYLCNHQQAFLGDCGIELPSDTTCMFFDCILQTDLPYWFRNFVINMICNHFEVICLHGRNHFFPPYALFSVNDSIYLGDTVRVIL